MLKPRDPLPLETADDLFSGPGEVARLMREKDWSKTSLGPPRDWPRSLRTLVRVVLNSRFSMWMGWGPDLNFFYNDAYRPTLGGKHPASLGQPFRELWAEIWPELRPRVDTVLLRGEATWDEALLLFVERNGYTEETYFTFSYSPIVDDGGHVAGLFCVVTEETERVIGERRLALLRELATQLSGTRTEPQVCGAVARCLQGGTKDFPFSLIYLFDVDARVARLVAGSGFADGHPAAAPTLSLDQAGPWPFSTAAVEAGPVVIELDPAAWPRGPWSAGPRNALLVPISHPGQSQPAGVFIAGLNPFRPVDEPYRDFLRLFVGQIAAGLANGRAYEQERMRAKALEDLDRAKTAFFANVSHEFRTPLTLMLGPIADLLAEAPTGRTREQLVLLQRNGLRLLKLVNTMLEVSRIEAGRVHASIEPVDLAELTADLASAFRSATDKAGLRLRVDCSPLREPVLVDRDMWEKIVFNLVSNAFKFTLAGEIAVRLVDHGDQVRLTVSDTGTGIPAHELPHLFDRFHRVEGSSGRTHEGTGIGLALVQELVRLHEGTVTVESELDKGSAFTVSLPRARAQVAAAPARPVVRAPDGHVGKAFVEEALRWLPDAAEADVEQPTASIERARVLLADDNADMRQYIQRLLAPRWNVEAVANGREALEAALHTRPDLVVTDVMMPLLDGFGLLTELRRHEGTRDVPVLMLSARAGEESRLEALEAGASDYLVKPFAARELLARVDSILLRERIRGIEEAQARRLEAVFSQAPVAIAILSGPRHVFEIANPPYLEIVGHRAVIGKPVREALPELEGQGVVDTLDRAFASGEPIRANSFRVLLERRGSLEECFFDYVFQPLVEAGRVGGIAVVAYEVTELARARRQAELANRAKDEFLAMLGHELRNPLAPIVTALQLMRMRGDTAGERERGVIERQVKHLVSMVDDLLDVSRVTRGKIELRKSRLEIAQIVAQAIETASPLFERHRHALSVEVPPHGLVVDGDPGRLAQAIANLLTNAAKYTPPGGRVTVRAEASADHVVLHVRDTGIGIDAEMIGRIFEPFAQEQQAIDRAQGGLGLGLAIVKSLIGLHGGSVTAHSEGRNRGAEFTITLPRAQIAGVAGAPAAPAPVLVAKTPGVRVLIVDDNEDAGDMLAAVLKDDRYDVRTEYDGPAALQAAGEFQPQIAILDLGLPVMDGFELAERLARSPRLQGIRLIAVTGYGQPEDRARSAAAGFAAHLVKPVEAETLRSTIRGLSVVRAEPLLPPAG